MKPSERIAEMVISQIKELKEETLIRFDRVESKIEDLTKFKWKVYGATAVISFIITIGVEAVARGR